MERRRVLKKGLGQHLLKDGNLLEKMVRLAGVGTDDAVVEIGPGEGDLTRRLAAKARVIYAVELDQSFRGVLGRLEQEFPNVRVIFSDALRVRFADFGAAREVAVMGNIPYYLTGDLLFKLLFEKSAIKGAFLTMQKEVAQRIASRSHLRSYGALSVIFQLYSRVKVLLSLKPSLFIPPPKVDSAFISIVFNDSSEADPELISFIKQCFRYKRKQLRHSLAERFKRDAIDALYGRLGFPASIRAEEIEPGGFVEMYRTLRMLEKGS
jgi:16S rRNA (adenine1518-N6/adenine1519-N6)-dimethyltransferase